MEFLRTVDFERLAASGGKESQQLLGNDSGVTSCTVNCIKTPPGDRPPATVYTHPFDQLFYVLSGTMSLEIGGNKHEAGPGTLVVLPAGVPHRNWNGGSEPTLHLVIEPDMPYIQMVG
jgi:quercetin dioxygenase-like cupin family protein